jgi:hypothetical protein
MPAVLAIKNFGIIDLMVHDLFDHFHAEHGHGRPVGAGLPAKAFS